MAWQRCLLVQCCVLVWRLRRDGAPQEQLDQTAQLENKDAEDLKVLKEKQDHKVKPDQQVKQDLKEHQEMSNRTVYLVDDDEVAPPRSPASANATLRPRPVASRAIPHPLMPPPITKRSYILLSAN